MFQCDNCGFECDRDVNAAINLEKEAVRLTIDRGRDVPWKVST
ncbi:zinc ribbon domain-containing protein [Dolichospermum circinale CS-1225]|nr:transposase [Dolichospermum circinale]MDB9457010.1 zinc ribbon domain-containing protein [Dolichospermum circinale CS-545/17]MDB9467358.1 zinc ribbon domain-containing protein [Dolichospermum circinale CS-539/09]MDB9524034.1 zinc ribbon domain-containing protein [Dolichospermum circinale CS-1225]